MKGLSMRNWSLIARYLKQEASRSDLDQFDLLVKKHPNLKMELEILGREMNTPSILPSFKFKADKAFKKLNQRFEKENLL